MKIPKDVKLIIFDMDGVLWISERAHASAYIDVFDSVGITSPDYQTLAGRETSAVIQAVLNDHGLNWDISEIKKLVDQKRYLAHDSLKKNPPLVDDCAETLIRLSANYQLALASSGSRRNVQLLLNTCNANSLFSTVLSGEDVEEAKPSPEIYLKVLQELNVKASEALVIEDALHGIHAANRAGIRVIAVTTMLDKSCFEDSQVFGIISNINELKHD